MREVELNHENELIQINDVTVEFDGKLVLDHITLCLERGQRLALMGPSGVGKSTLLRLLAGLVEPTSGNVERRGSVSMVFDRDGLYPMLTGSENVELGVDWAQMKKTRRRQEAGNWIHIFDADSFAHQKTRTLSAGQRKRIALARAMMKKPDLLLLDETFHALDKTLRLQLMETILRLQKEMGFALVFATHDPAEAELLDAQVLYLEDEKPLQETC